MLLNLSSGNCSFQTAVEHNKPTPPHGLDEMVASPHSILRSTWPILLWRLYGKTFGTSIFIGAMYRKLKINPVESDCTLQGEGKDILENSVGANIGYIHLNSVGQVGKQKTHNFII